MGGGGISDSKSKPLLGTDEATIDGKGRILISKKKRERLGNDFVIALGEVGCLTAYPESCWEDILSEIGAYPPSSSGRQQFTRLILGTAEDELNCDAQGRVVVPSKLRELAGLREKVILVGAFDRLEIWDAEEYQNYLNNPDSYGQERRDLLERARSKMVDR